MFSHRTSWNLNSNPFSQALDAYRTAGRRVLDLTQSNPTQVGMRYDAGVILTSLAHPEALCYAPHARGLASARQAVAEYYAGITRRFPLQPGDKQPEADSVVLTVSTSEAYSFLFRLLCDPGDEVLVPVPSYPLFEFLAGLHDVRLVPYSLFYDHGWHIDRHSLEAAVTSRARAILLVHPNNPTGSYVKLGERKWLNCLAAAKGLALVVDEVFLDYSIGWDEPASAGHEYDEPVASFAGNTGALTFTLSGLSKISALPQMKLAWIAVNGPESLTHPARSRLEVIADTFLSLSAPIQLAAPSLLAQGPALQQQLRERIRANLGELDRQLSRQSLCSRLRVEGGWYVIMRVPATRSDEDFAVALLQATGVLVQPGYFYDFPGDGYLVLSLITPEEQFAAGIRHFIGFVEKGQ